MRNLNGPPDFRQTDSSEARLNRLESLLRETGAEPGDAVALFADLLGIPIGTRNAIDAMSPLQRKGLLFRTFLAQLEGLAARGPVLMVLEDAHWLDPTSRELFDQIVDRLQRLPVLLVVDVPAGSLSAVDRLSSRNAAHAEPLDAATGSVVGRAGRRR